MLADDLFWRCSGLDGGDFDSVIQTAGNMDVIAELTNADIFIDCRDEQTGGVFVAAHASPSQGSPLYSGPVSGQQVLPENEAAVYAAFKNGMPVHDIKAVTQENRLVSQDVVPLFGAGGGVIAVIIRETDITQSLERLKKIELLENTINRLKSSLEGFQKDRDDVVNYINTGVVLFDGNDVAVYFNAEAARVYKAIGFSEPLIGMTFEEATFGNGELAGSRENPDREADMFVGNLSLTMRGYQLGRSDMGGILALLIDDRTELQKKEKEVISHSRAIKEINHRIKNSLQMVGSMLSIQSRRIDNQDARDALQSTISRVYNISMVYDLLTKQNLSQDLWLRELLYGVVRCAQSYVSSEALDLSVSILGDDLRVSGDTATTIGIIVHELVVNAIRHGFLGRSSGEIRVHLQKGNLYSTIVVEDNGVGYAPGGGREGFGVSLARMMTNEKLDGRLHTQSSGAGTKVMFSFKNQFS